ncbi:ubiquitin-specific protease doa4 [Coemansia sp. RSA 552]|nr:ubiquitin-specific protease doa4 [Coemansia sp. RSA 552]
MSGQGNGRNASALIQRFENMAVPDKEPEKPPILPRYATTPAARPPPPLPTKPKPKEPADSEPSPVASLEAAQSALSAAIAHAKVPPSRWNRRPSMPEATRKRPVNVPANTLVDTPASPAEPEPKASLDSAKKPPLGSTSLPLNALRGRAVAARDEGTIPALNRRAEIEADESQIPNNLWLEFAEQCVSEAQKLQKSGSAQEAYVKYMMACNVFSKKLQRTRENSGITNNANYIRLRTDISTWVVEELETLQKELEGKPRAALGDYRPPAPRESNRVPSTQGSPPESRTSLRSSHTVARRQSPPGDPAARRTEGVTDIIEDDSSEVDSDDNNSRKSAMSNSTSSSDLSSMLSYHAPLDSRSRASNGSAAGLSRNSSQQQTSRPSSQTPSAQGLNRPGNHRQRPPSRDADRVALLPPPPPPPRPPLPALGVRPRVETHGATHDSRREFRGPGYIERPPEGSVAPAPFVPEPHERDAPVEPYDDDPGFPPGMDHHKSPMSPSKRHSQVSDAGTFGMTGLRNFGNTCFMNSVIQCLIGTKPLARYFLRGEWKKRLITGNGDYVDVICEYANLVECMLHGQFSSFSPKGFLAAVAQCSEQFDGTEQEDAQEFATFLLDVLHESLNQVCPRPPPEREMTPSEELVFEGLTNKQQSKLQWELYTRRNLSIVTDIFQGQIQSRLTCMVCAYTSTTYHTFTELSIPIPTPHGDGISMDYPVNIYECLDSYSETEILDGDNMWMCPQCETKRQATKKLMISRLPLVLILHLKRFSTR